MTSQIGHCLDQLKTLVVQRLFELTKLRLSGTGYKLHKKIGKALKACVEAIKKVLSEYNARAAELSPPWEALSWNNILVICTCSALSKTNAQLNVEISRPFMYMVDEHYHYYDAIPTSLLTNILLAHKLSQCWQYRQVVNSGIVQHLLQATKLDGFTGKLEAGLQQGSTHTCLQYISPPLWARLEPIVHAYLSEAVASIPGAVTEREEEVFVDFMDALSAVTWTR
ncbi:hypothetical protein C8Q70DRAFT_934640 [Cubamyces menziesii]|nr:hypothetical protein C8Q70DRAFT_934640 [Cubamyces menziesii]